MLSSVLLIVLQLCSVQLMVVTKPTCHPPGSVALSAHHLLNDLVGTFPIHCVQYNANISFPDSVFPTSAAKHIQCRQALWVVNESLDKAAQLFDDHDLPVGEGGLSWDKVKFDTFQNLQHRLLEEGSCLSAVESSDVLSSYFRNVTAVLQQQDSAACGWMALGRDLVLVLKTALQKFCTCFKWDKADGFCS